MYDGDAILRRYGGFPGFHAQISLMPERGLGVVVLANGGSASVGVAGSTAAFAYDLLLGKPSAKEIGDKRWAAFAADSTARVRLRRLMSPRAKSASYRLRWPWTLMPAPMKTRRSDT